MALPHIQEPFGSPAIGSTGEVNGSGSQDIGRDHQGPMQSGSRDTGRKDRAVGYGSEDTGSIDKLSWEFSDQSSETGLKS